jgi:hypothetical protein
MDSSVSPKQLEAHRTKKRGTSNEEINSSAGPEQLMLHEVQTKKVFTWDT